MIDFPEQWFPKKFEEKAEFSKEEDFIGNDVFPVNIDGKICHKNKMQYPYSYDEFVLFRRKDFKKNNKYHGVYSDRILEWDWDKHNELCMKHFGNEGQYWNNREIKKIEAFLRDYFDNQSIELMALVEGCNIGNGYPYWIFLYKEERKENR